MGSSSGFGGDVAAGTDSDQARASRPGVLLRRRDAGLIGRGPGGSSPRAVWRPAVGAWHVDGAPTAYLGADGDTPLPLPAAIYGAFF